MKTAEATRSDDRRKETKPSANDHYFSSTALSSGTSSADRTLDVLRMLEKHLILNSNRLRTFEDARLKFGLRIRDSKPSDTGSRGQTTSHGC